MKERIKALQKKIGATSMSETIRRSIEALEAEQEGGES